jgi:hypothetical protein
MIESAKDFNVCGTEPWQRQGENGKHKKPRRFQSYAPIREPQLLYLG